MELQPVDDDIPGMDSDDKDDDDTAARADYGGGCITAGSCHHLLHKQKRSVRNATCSRTQGLR